MKAVAVMRVEWKCQLCCILLLWAAELNGRLKNVRDGGVGVWRRGSRRVTLRGGIRGAGPPPVSLSLDRFHDDWWRVKCSIYNLVRNSPETTRQRERTDAALQICPDGVRGFRSARVAAGGGAWAEPLARGCAQEVIVTMSCGNN